jgi:general secretion pathway protein L
MQLTEQSWAELFDTSTRVPLDLMTAIGSYQPSNIDWYVWRWPIALTGTLAVFNIIALNADWWRLRSEGMRVRDDIMAIYQRSFPNDKVVLDPLAQMNKKIAASRSASGQLNTSDFIVLSATLGEVWRESGHDLRIIAALEYRDGTLSIKLKQGVQIYPEKLRRLLTARQMQLTPSPADPLLWQLRSL